MLARKSLVFTSIRRNAMKHLVSTTALLMAFACFQVTTMSAQTHRPEAEKITNGPVVEGVGDTWATIAWTTDTGGSTIVRYGKNRDKMDQMSEAPYADNEDR